MRAVYVDGPGGSFRVTEVDAPAPGPGEVLVEVHASGVNPLDAKIRAGLAPHARHPLPAILGLDIAGVVVGMGDGVEGFELGDEVYGMTGGVGGVQGSLAEYAAVDARLLALKPRGFSMREAAATPLVFITAWEALVDRAQLTAVQRVLVQGGAGGVGHAAVQIARAFGAEVFATGRATNAAVIAALGAKPIDYAAAPVADYVDVFTEGAGFDIVFDTVGGEVLDASFAAVRQTGHVVSCLGWGTHSLAPLSMKNASYSGVFALLPLLTGSGRQHHGDILRQATELADAGQFRPILHEQRFSLDTVDLAHDALARRAEPGKIVVDVRS